MIDFHTHILPNIDDGARSIGDTYELMKEAKKAGFKGVLLTSHYLEGFYETDDFERKVWKEVLTQNADIEKIELNLYVASEIYFSENIIKLLENKKASTINDTNYILFELPLNYEPLNLLNEIYNILGTNIVPILAHPERYPYIQKHPNKVYDLIDKGVLIQCNYGSFIGQYGKKAQKTALQLLEHNMVHFLGSDVHKPNTIYPKINEIIPILKEKIGIDAFKKITEINPEYVLKNKKIIIEEPTFINVSIIDKVKGFFSR